jgi:ubiquinone/menaquinone biosynthesis C-methylase UbiE
MKKKKNPSQENMKKMYDELYRILKPGSRFITFSLHPAHEVIGHFIKNEYVWWKVSYYNVYIFF